MPKGTTLKEMVKTRSYIKKLFLMVTFPEFLGNPTYTISTFNFKFSVQPLLVTHIPHLLLA